MLRRRRPFSMQLNKYAKSTYLLKLPYKLRTLHKKKEMNSSHSTLEVEQISIMNSTSFPNKLKQFVCFLEIIFFCQ